MFNWTGNPLRKRQRAAIQELKDRDYEWTGIEPEQLTVTTGSSGESLNRATKERVRQGVGVADFRHQDCLSFPRRGGDDSESRFNLDSKWHRLQAYRDSNQGRRGTSRTIREATSGDPIYAQGHPSTLPEGTHALPVRGQREFIYVKVNIV